MIRALRFLTVLLVVFVAVGCGDEDKPPGRAAPEAGAENLYRHRSGLSFPCPPEWTVRELGEDNLQIVPPNPVSDETGPKEIYFVTIDRAAGEGITRPSDPRVIAHLDRQIVKQYPYLKRSEPVSTLDATEGGGAMVNWMGRSPSGDEVHAQARVRVHRGMVVALFAVGRKDLLDERDADMQRLFASFGFGPE